MKTIALIIPWFGTLRNDFAFWLKSVEYNPSIDFLFFTDQDITTPPRNLKVIKSNLKHIDYLAKKYVWEGSVIAKAYKVCDYRPAFGELFCDYLSDYDWWGHCDVDLIFGDIRHFINEAILNRYDRIGVNGPFTLYRNKPEVNSSYREMGDVQKIFSEQKPFGFDEWGINKCGTSYYWINNFSDRLWRETVFDNLAPFHYSFVSGAVRNSKKDIKNLMFSYEQGKLYRIGSINGEVNKHETLYVHLQKRPIIIKTENSAHFSIIPPGKIIPLVDKVTTSYLKWNIRDSRFWAYYIRLMNKLMSMIGKKPYSDMVLFPEDDDYVGKYEKPFYWYIRKYIKL